MVLTRSLALATLLFALTPGLTIAASQGQNFAQPGDPAGPQYGEAAPTFRLHAYNEDDAVKLVNSADISLHNFVGIAPEAPKKAVVLHFFSAQHAQSKSDLAILQRMYKKYADDGLMVISVSIDADEPEKVYDVMEDNRVTYPVLKDRFGVVARRYGLKTLPSLYVIGAEGNVLSLREGYSEDISDVLDGEIKSALN